MFVYTKSRLVEILNSFHYFSSMNCFLPLKKCYFCSSKLKLSFWKLLLYNTKKVDNIILKMFFYTWNSIKILLMRFWFSVILELENTWFNVKCVWMVLTKDKLRKNKQIDKKMKKDNFSFAVNDFVCTVEPELTTISE